MIVDAKPYEYTFDPEKTALLVIDMQRDFCEHGGFGEMLGNDISEVTAIIPQVGKVIDHCRSLGMPVIYTKEGHLPDLSDCPPPGNDIVPELYPKEEDIVIHKCGKGSFYKTALEDILQEKGIESLIVTGVTTHVCVQTTIREANDRGYECLLIVDASAAYDRADHLASLQMITQQGAIFGWTADTESLLKA